MMKNTVFLLSFMFMVFCQSVQSHIGGHGPVSETQAIDIASFIVDQFINHDPGLGFGKLNRSWNDLQEDEKRIHKKGDGYYIVSATNRIEGKTLYILMSIAGEVYDANFSGEFQGLK